MPDEARRPPPGSPTHCAGARRAPAPGAVHPRCCMSVSAKSRATAIVGLLLLAAIAGLLVTSPRPPEYGGRTLDEWLVLLDPHVDRKADHDKATDALSHMGPAALPRLSRILRSRPDSITQRIRDYAVRRHVMNPPRLIFQEQQFRAARAAYHLAEDADVNIAALVPDLRYHYQVHFCGHDRVRDHRPTA